MSYEMSAVAKDAFVILNQATRIDYRGGDFWEADKEHPEHPLVPRLRVACMASLTTDAPPTDVKPPDVGDDLINSLKEERRANEAMRVFLRDLEDLCHNKGMDEKTVGREVLKWLETNLATGS